MKERSILIRSNGKRPQIGKRRIAGAEIVHRDFDAERLDLPQRRERAVQIAHQRRLGNLDLEPLRRQTGFEQDLMQFLDERGIVKLHGRDVDGDLERHLPGRGFAAGFPQNPVADRQDSADLLGDRNENGWRYLATGRVLPPHQRLEADHLAALGYRAGADRRATTRHAKSPAADRVRAAAGHEPQRPSSPRRNDRCCGLRTSPDRAPRRHG